MAEIKEYLNNQVIMIEFSPDEFDQLLEIAATQEFTFNEVVLAAFKIGLIQLTAKTMRDKAGI